MTSYNKVDQWKARIQCNWPMVKFILASYWLFFSYDVILHCLHNFRCKLWAKFIFCQPILQFTTRPRVFSPTQPNKTRIVDKIMPYLPVIRRHASGWKGDANFRSQILQFEKNIIFILYKLYNLASITFIS